MLRDIFALIADGKPWPLDTLAAAAGISAQQLPAMLDELVGMGASFAKLHSQLCQLDAPVELLDIERIRQQLDSAALHALDTLDIEWTTGSTNLQAAALMAGSDHKGVACLAEHQTAGRGRRGRHWSSPLGANLYLSVGWHFAGGLAEVEGLSLAIGVVIAEVLAQDFCLQNPGMQAIGLKWPNDVLCNNRKIAGILIESQLNQDGSCSVIAGIGINANMSVASVAAINQPVTSMNLELINLQLGRTVSRNELAACVINRLVKLLMQFPETTFAGYRQAWESRNIHQGQTVTLTVNQQMVTGKVVGVDNRGALRLDINGTEQLFDAGEVSLSKTSPA
jgi:BirA family biotin operon repressor/biotin-[acetyl-CoA-carboxylase] ligase